jgi:hypothetical protein
MTLKRRHTQKAKSSNSNRQIPGSDQKINRED